MMRTALCLLLVARVLCIAPVAQVDAATHATRGVVKFVDDTTLVIVRFAHRGEMTFRLRTSTKREGVIAPGATVSVRYVEEGQTNVATAVALQQPGEPARPWTGRS